MTIQFTEAHLPCTGHAASGARPAQAISPLGLNASKATAPRAQLLTLTSPSLHIRQTGSCLQILLTSSPLNSDGRAHTIYIDEPFTAVQIDGLLPTIHIDEPFTAYQTDGLLPTNFIDELSPQLRWTNSYYLH